MIDLIITPQVSAAEKLAQAVMTSSNSKVGRITGAPGTGKTIIGHHLRDKMDGVRLCAYAGISVKAIMMGLAEAVGVDERGTATTILMRLADRLDGRMIIIDEANHLQWKHIEMLRYLPDEANVGLLLIGTDLLERSFRDGKSAIYLRQMAGRIGAKQMQLKPMTSDKEVAQFVLSPNFGSVTQATAKAFMKGCGGYWRLAFELKEACQRIMLGQDEAKLDDEVVRAAIHYMGDAGAR